MADFSPAANQFADVDAGDDLYDSEEHIDASYGDESDSYANEGSQYSDGEESDERAGDEFFDESASQLKSRAAPAAAQAPAATADALSVALQRQATAIESLATELSLMRAPTQAIKLTSDQIESGVKHRRVKLYLETSLEALSKKGADNRLRLLGDPKKIFGSGQVTISSIDIDEIDNHMPVSLMLDAEHLPGEKLRTEPTVIGELAMADAPRAGRRTFTQPLRVYKSTENQFSIEFSKKFADYSAENLADDITEVRAAALLGDKISAPQGPVALVPAPNPVMATIKMAREQNGDTVDEKTYIPHLQSFVVSAPEVTRAINTIREALAASTEATPVQNIFFTIARSNLTQQTIEKLGSLENEPWKDPAEIGTSLKDGQVRATEYKKVKPITVTATIAYRPL